MGAVDPKQSKGRAAGRGPVHGSNIAPVRGACPEGVAEKRFGYWFPFQRNDFQALSRVITALTECDFNSPDQFVGVEWLGQKEGPFD
jgi:hypothetical protein